MKRQGLQPGEQAHFKLQTVTQVDIDFYLGHFYAELIKAFRNIGHWYRLLNVSIWPNFILTSYMIGNQFLSLTQRHQDLWRVVYEFTKSSLHLAAVEFEIGSNDASKHHFSTTDVHLQQQIQYLISKHTLSAVEKQKYRKGIKLILWKSLQ